jgi:hypothetical protein
MMRMPRDAVTASVCVAAVDTLSKVAYKNSLCWIGRGTRARVARLRNVQVHESEWKCTPRTALQSN